MHSPTPAGPANSCPVQEMVIRVDKIFGGGRGRGEKRRMKVGEEWEWTNQGHWAQPLAALLASRPG